MVAEVRHPECRKHSFIPLACAECDDSMLFSGTSSIPLCYVLFLATLLHQLFFCPLSPHLAIYFFVYLSVLLFPNSECRKHGHIKPICYFCLSVCLSVCLSLPASCSVVNYRVRCCTKVKHLSHDLNFCQ